MGDESAIDQGHVGLAVARAGFTHTGTLPQVGRKFDRWLDLAFLTLVLGESDRGRTV